MSDKITLQDLKEEFVELRKKIVSYIQESFNNKTKEEKDQIHTEFLRVYTCFLDDWVLALDPSLEWEEGDNVFHWLEYERGYV